MKFTRSSHEAQIIRSLYEFHMYFMRTVYEPHVNFISIIWVWYINFISPSIWTSYELHTNCMLIHLNEFDFISYEIHEKFLWTLYEVQMNLSWISYELIRFHFKWNPWEVHMNFIWSPYEVNNTFLCSSNKFHVKLWIYGFIWISYEWASRSIVVLPYELILVQICIWESVILTRNYNERNLNFGRRFIFACNLFSWQLLFNRLHNGLLAKFQPFFGTVLS